MVQRETTSNVDFEMAPIPVIFGLVTDEKGNPIPEAEVRLEQNHEEIVRGQTDTSGRYRLRVDAYRVRGRYDLSAIHGELGDWRLDIPLREGSRETVNLTLKTAMSISGTVLMLDDTTPHVALLVQAVQSDTVVDAVLTDKSGKYRFLNLKPGRYQVRCQIPHRYVYYGEDSESSSGKVLRVAGGVTHEKLDFRIAPFLKGTWRHYTVVDGLAGNQVFDIYRDLDGTMWFGTNSGVSHYDGHTFTNFATDYLVEAVYRDLDGVMWFGTRHRGLLRYDGKKWLNFTTKDGLAAKTVSTIHQTPDGVLWFGTGSRWEFAKGYGISRYDGVKFTNLTTADGLVDDRVLSIYQSPDDVLWFGSRGGLSRYDGTQFVNFS